MKNHSTTNPDKGLNFYNIVAWIYLAAFVVVIYWLGLSPWLFLTFTLIAGIFILPKHWWGIPLMLSLTMLFEKNFTLDPLIIGHEAYKLYPLDIVIGLTIIGWVIHYYLNQNKRPKIIIGIPEKILFFLILIFSAFFVVSLFDINSDLSIAFSSFKNYTFYPALYFLTLYSIQNQNRLKTTVHTILYTGIIIIGFIIFGFINGQGLWTEFTPLSTEGTRYLAGTHAFYLLLASLIALSLFAYDKFSNKLLIGLIIWLWILGIIVSLMRHLWLGLAFGCLTIILLLPVAKRKKMIDFTVKNILIIICLIIATVLITQLWQKPVSQLPLYEQASNLKYRATSILSAENDSSANWRLSLWQTAQKEWLNNPIFGIGFGKKINLKLNNWQTFEEVRNMHNSPLAILVQTGFIGILLFGSFIFSVFATSWQYIKTNQLFPYYAGLIAGVAVFLLLSFFQPYLEANLVSIFFWIFLGLISTSRIIK